MDLRHLYYVESLSSFNAGILIIIVSTWRTYKTDALYVCSTSVSCVIIIIIGGAVLSS
jgi:hypothetical protein